MAGLHHQLATLQATLDGKGLDKKPAARLFTEVMLTATAPMIAGLMLVMVLTGIRHFRH